MAKKVSPLLGDVVCIRIDSDTLKVIDEIAARFGPNGNRAFVVRLALLRGGLRKVDRASREVVR